jgi:hypothetical protein
VPKQPKDESPLVIASKRLGREKKIEVAERDKIEELESYVEKVLEVIGHPEAFVTDESMVWDFVPLPDQSLPVVQDFCLIFIRN